MTNIQIDAGTLTASSNDRTMTGLLVPFGEDCRSNLGRFTVEAGSFEIPSDLTGMSLNVEHQREDVIGGFLAAHETPEGIVATFSIANTPEGDQALADVEAGKRKHLSVEASNVVIKAGKAIAGRLFAAALVATPAFPSATLLAAAADTLDPNMPVDPNAPVDPAAVVDPNAAPADPNAAPIETKAVSTDEFTDENGVTWTRKVTEDTVIDGTTTTITTTEVIEEPPTQAQTQGDTMSNTATVPGSLQASAPIATKERPTDAKTVFAALANAYETQDRETLMAALSDIKFDGNNTFGVNAQVPDYVGEVWSGRRFQRKVIPLLSSAVLTSMTIKGWRYVNKPVVNTWAGNKAAVASNAASTEPAEWTAQRFAGAWDIAREFIDFGQSAIIEDFLTKAADSYAKVTDEYVLDGLVSSAITAPVGSISSNSDLVSLPSVVKLVRGAMRVIAEDALPSFALVANDVYEELALLKENSALKMLSMSLGLENGQLSGFNIVPHAGLAAGDVLVGAREAATVYELGGAPIRVNALEIAKGGIDEALFGYAALRVDYAEGLQLVTNNAA